MSAVNRDVTEAASVLACRDLTHSSEPQAAPVPEAPSTGDTARRVAAVFAGAVLVVAAVTGLHGLYRAGGDVVAWSVWVVELLAGMTALGGGIKLIAWGIKPAITAVSVAGKHRLAEPVQAVIAAVAVIAGALGMWWTLRGGYAEWWQHLSGETSWTLLLGIGQMLMAVLAGAALFTGGKYLTGLATEVLTDAGMLGARDRTPGSEGAGAHRNQSRTDRDESVWHPGLVAALIGGGLGLVLLTAGITPRLYVWITGPDVLPAVAAIVAVLVWGVGANLGWWKGLAGLWQWATDASHKAAATSGVVALLMFSAGGLGLGWFTPATVPQAHAQCPPDCGGGSNGSGSYGPDASQFQPPQMPGQMPDYQGGINQPALDQNSSISIYNTQAPSVSNNGVQGSSGQQGPQQSWDQPAHGTQIPDYQNAAPYTQGPGRPNPDFNPGSQGGQANPGSDAGSQGGQPNQGAQQPVQQPQQASQQPTQQDAGQQPNQSPDQSSDQQKIDDLTRQLQEKQQQSSQDRQRIDDLTKQLQQQGQQRQNGNQKLPKAPSKDKKQDDKDQQDRDDQSGDNDLSALLLGAASTRRRKQDEQDSSDQQQPQGPDTQALADGAQLGQSLPGDIANTVSDSVNLGQSAGSAAQNFGSAAQAGASLASSAQSGAVNPMDAVALVQGVSGGISDTADAVGSGASIASTWLNNAGQGAQLAADANPQLKAEAEQAQQLTQAGGQVADLTGKVAGGVSQVSGMVNTASSLGTSGMPDTSDVGDATDALSGTATAVNGPGDVPTPNPDPSAGSLKGTMGILDQHPQPPKEYKPAPGEGVPRQVGDGVNGRVDGLIDGIKNLTGQGGPGAPGVAESWLVAGIGLTNQLTNPFTNLPGEIREAVDNPAQLAGEKLFDVGSTVVGGALGSEGAAFGRSITGSIGATEARALPGASAAVPVAGEVGTGLTSTATQIGREVGTGLTSTATQIGREVAQIPKGGTSQTATLAEKLTALKLNQAQAAEATNIASKAAFGETAGIASLPDGTKMVLPAMLPQKIAMQVLPDGSVSVFRGDLVQFVQYLGK
ncbi:hypothetical protein [Mycobacteroides abscessus]|uniref:hypothetical protein n=1 Tax=Mycobacteroides abscessus TaxID=36809 RepID=UPI001F1DB2F4|nr:hypothetical protein [Mycobacteroides abscessus]